MRVELTSLIPQEGGAHSVMVIIIRNKQGDPGSNSEQS